MSSKIDVSSFRLRAINFDNARDLDIVCELIENNLSSEEFTEFKSKIIDLEDEGADLSSVLVTYDEIAVAQIAYDFQPLTGETLVLAPVIDKKYEYMRHFVNSMIWRTLNRLSKRQNWQKVNFSAFSYGDDVASVNAADFRSYPVDILPGSAAASLKDQIEVVHGQMEIVNIDEQN